MSFQQARLLSNEPTEHVKVDQLDELVDVLEAELGSLPMEGEAERGEIDVDVQSFKSVS